MIPNNQAFNGKEYFEENGKLFYRSYKIEGIKKYKLHIQINSINSPYHQAIAFSLSTTPRFKGHILINGISFDTKKTQQAYVMPVEFPYKTIITMEVDVEEGYIRIANASDFLDDYPDLIEKISAQTGRTRENFRGCSYASGFSAGFLYGNAFWIEEISDNKHRFHCNDHKLDDDFDDMIFDIEIEKL